MEITQHHCTLPSNRTPPSLGGLKEDHHHLESDTNRTKDTTCCNKNKQQKHPFIHLVSVIWCSFLIRVTREADLTGRYSEIHPAQVSSTAGQQPTRPPGVQCGTSHLCTWTSSRNSYGRFFVCLCCVEKWWMWPVRRDYQLLTFITLLVNVTWPWMKMNGHEFAQTLLWLSF